MPISEPGVLLRRGEVHVWHGLITAEPSSEDYAVLSDAERARSARFVRPGDSARFVAAHAAQRRLLARYLDTGPAAIRFGRSACCRCGSTEHGRPSIEWPPTALNHNLSRSRQHWLLAVAADGPVGADIECHRGIDIGRMADATLTAAEGLYLREQPDERRQWAFFLCWTRKEAVLKACGIGLAAKLGGLEVHPERSGPVEVHHASGTCPDTWLVQDVTQGPWRAQSGGTAQVPGRNGAGSAGWSGAVAQPAGQARPVRFLTFP
jgi:4'-phosphopantetheinyl transferase